MSVVAVTPTKLNNSPAHQYAWLALATGDTGAPVALPNAADCSIQVTGTFGGATAVLEGSNDGGTTWVTLRDPGGTALSFTTANLKQVLEVVGLIRPSVSGGTSVALNFYLVSRVNQ